MNLDWLAFDLRLVSKYQFRPTAFERLWSGGLQFVPFAAAAQTRRDAWTVEAPYDVPAPLVPQSVRRFPLNGTDVTVWNPLPKPPADVTPWPSEACTLFWRAARSKVLVPAWNLFATALDLLSFREEREIQTRDGFKRFPIGGSPRLAAGLMTVPFVNDSLCLVLAALNAQDDGAENPLVRTDDLQPVTLALSHDCDSLNGRDFFSQAARCVRGMRPLLHGRPPDLRSLWAIGENLGFPRRYYFDNMFGMFDMEREFGMRSVSYVLNGTRGRFGARTPNRINDRFCKLVPDGWTAGIHYNFDTLGDPIRFEKQLGQIRAWTGREVFAGRAHYVRFSAVRDFGFIAAHGIRYDESIGWPAVVSYRCGIAGPFIPLTADGERLADVVEMPLVMCDSAIPAAPENSGSFAALFGHLRRVGGVLSILVHPGTFHNPETPGFIGRYHNMLSTAYRCGSTSALPAEVLATAASIRVPID